MRRRECQRARSPRWPAKLERLLGSERGAVWIAGVSAPRGARWRAAAVSARWEDQWDAAPACWLCGLRDWQAAGVWEQLHAGLLARRRGARTRAAGGARR